MKEIKAPMAGIVVQITAKSGDTVREGTEVAILESMKMQIPISADVSGKVVQIHFSQGDFVNEGDIILTIE